MNVRLSTSLVAIVVSLALACPCSGQDQQPKPQNATSAVVRAFDTHDIVLFGEAHGCKQEYEWLRALVSTPEFADRVDDIVVELGNSRYQNSVDRYIAGEDVPFEQVQEAWRDAIGMIGAPSPVLESLYRAVRQGELGAPRKASDAHKCSGALPATGTRSRFKKNWNHF